MKNKFLLILGILICFLFGGSQGVAAVNVGGKPQTPERTPEQSYGTNFSDYSMKGLFSTCEQTFWVSDQWDVKDVLVHLEYKATQLADVNLSSITIGINGNYFYSFRPADNIGNRHGLEFYVPLEFLKSGYNTIKIDGYMRTQEDFPCVDDVSEGNWLDVFKESSINVYYTENLFTTDIASFYERFYEINTVKNQDSAFVTSGNKGEINSALLGIAGISNQTIYSDGYFPLLTMDDPENERIKNKILICLFDGLPEKYKAVVNQTGLLDDENALMVLVNEDGSKNTLVITGKNEAALINAGVLLGNSELMPQLTGSTKVLGKNEDVYTEVYSPEIYIPFTGDQGAYFNGPFRQEHKYSVSYPGNRSLTDASEVYLKYRYSENLDFNRSLMTVYINDIPIGSRKLSQDKAGGDEATLPIPSGLEIKKNFEIRVTFDLEIQDLWCTLRQGEMPWAYLTPETMMKVNSVASQDLIFENYPNPFVNDYSFNNTTVILPETLEKNTLETLGKMFRTLGTFTKGNTGTLNVIWDKEVDERTEDSNIIAIGSEKNNTYIKSINDKLFFKYTENGESFASNEKLKLDASYGHNLGSAQLLNSDLRKPGRGVLVVTAPTAVGMDAIGEEIGSVSELYKLTGDGILVDSNKKIMDYRFKEKPAILATAMKQVVIRQDAQAFILVGLLILIFIVVSAALIIRKNGISFKKGGRKK